MRQSFWHAPALCGAISMLITATSCPPMNRNHGGIDGDDTGNEVTTVEMRNIRFQPTEVTITVGQTVRWVNHDLMPHTSTSGNPGDDDTGSIWDSGILSQNESFERTFNETGTFVYYCDTHPIEMRDAIITVTEAP